MSNEQQPSTITNPTHQRNSVFISYNRKDKKYLEELKTHLAYYERAGKIVYWDDSKILPGSKWMDEINKALQSAKIAIFLVSADFFASDFIFDEELPPLLEAEKRGEVKVLPVILSPCPFSDSELASFQAVNTPDTPLKQMSSTKRDAVLHNVVKNIKAALGY